MSGPAPCAVSGGGSGTRTKVEVPIRSCVRPIIPNGPVIEGRRSWLSEMVEPDTFASPDTMLVPIRPAQSTRCPLVRVAGTNRNDTLSKLEGPAVRWNRPPSTAPAKNIWSKLVPGLNGAFAFDRRALGRIGLRATCTCEDKAQARGCAPTIVNRVHVCRSISRTLMEKGGGLTI